MRITSVNLSRARSGRAVPLANVGWVAATLMPIMALGQDAPPATGEPAPFFERGSGPAIAPTESAPSPVRPLPDDPWAATISGLPPGFALQATGQVSEGQVIGPLSGQIYRAGSDGLVFVPSAQEVDPSQPLRPRLGPMTLLPNQRLSQALATLSARGDAAGGAPVAANVWGQAFQYRSRSYVLATVITLVASAESGAAAPQPIGQQTASGPSDARAGADAPAASASNDRSNVPEDVARVIGELDEQAWTTRQVLTRPQTQPPGDGQGAADGAVPAPATSLVPERTVLVQRSGRVVRDRGAQQGAAGEQPRASGGGMLFFVLDNDADSPASAPLAVLPNRALEQLEDAVAQFGDKALYAVSGRITTFRERNYLLLDFFSVQPTTSLATPDIRPGQ